MLIIFKNKYDKTDLFNKVKKFLKSSCGCGIWKNIMPPLYDFS